jgi:dephospho-CoA kinase
MMIVGLTGSLAAGKSVVAAVFARRGIPVFDSDHAVYALYETSDMAEAMAKSFPAAVHGGKVDRARLAEHIGRTPQDLAVLEAIVHPRVRQAMLEFLERNRSAGASMVLLDVPLLFETRADLLVDKVVLVQADEAVRRIRALKRPGMTEAKLDALAARQMPQDEKARRADFIVENSKGLAELEAKVEELIYRLEAMAKEAKA